VLHNNASYSAGPFNGNVVSISPPTTASSDTFTYLVSPRYVFSPDLMVYARVASGFRPGTSNQAVLSGQVVPPQSSPDSTKSYEVGLKGDFLDHKLSIDTSIYHVDWKNIQIVVFTQAAYGYITNGSAAKSDGVEFSATLRPRAGLQVAAWVDYNNAVLTQDFPANASAFGLTGNRLPEGSRLSGNLSVDQDFALWNGATGSVGGKVSYIGDRLAAFNNAPITTREVFPAYTKIDLHGTVQYGSWKANLYVNNLADERGQIGTNSLVPGSLIYITPRTVGLSIAKRF
jgi:outer membrane receptor protein involved in Fe transport